MFPDVVYWNFYIFIVQDLACIGIWVCRQKHWLEAQKQLYYILLEKLQKNRCKIQARNVENRVIMCYYFCSVAWVLF